MPVGDNEQVKAGQILARIDDRDFKVALEQAKADVEAAKASIANKQAALDCPAVRRSTPPRRPSRSTRPTRPSPSRRTSATPSSPPRATAASRMPQQAASRIAAARATVARDTAALANATKQLDVLRRPSSRRHRRALARAEAVQHQAELNLSYTTIVSPIDGVIGNRTLRVGQYVQAGTQLMAVVPTQAAYIIANYKETQLTNVRAGQPVTSRSTCSRAELFRGHVDSLSPASGQEFALLPPDNATGNFTKVVQRIPVKIVLDPRARSRSCCGPACRSTRPSTPRRNRDPHRLSVANATAEPSPTLAQERRHVDHDCPSDARLSAFHAGPCSAVRQREPHRPGSPSSPA